MNTPCPYCGFHCRTKVPSDYREFFDDDTLLYTCLKGRLSDSKKIGISYGKIMDDLIAIENEQSLARIIEYCSFLEQRANERLVECAGK